MDVNKVADRYFEAVRARDIDALVALYAEDAVLALPNGKQVIGSAAIREFQTMVYQTSAPFPTPTARIAGEQGIAVEIEAKTNDGNVRHTANFFHLNDAGRIQRLSVYARS